MNARTVRIGKWAVVVFWLFAAVSAVPLSGKLTAAQITDDTAFLPTTAESTRVIAEQKARTDGQSLPTVVVYARTGGLTPADRAAVTAARQRLLGAGRVEASASPVTYSQDGRAALVTVAVPAPNDQNAQLANLNAVRATAGQALPDTLQVAVTGPGGAARDFAEVGAGIDSTLLIISVIVIAVILLLTYRSPVLWLIPLTSVGVAILVTQAVVYLPTTIGLVVNPQSASILTVLVFGVGTDYALLLIARYREELRHHTDRHAAMAVALRRAVPAVLASGATVAIGLLCLLVSQLTSNRGLGLVGAVGVVATLAAMTTLLPALLVVCGRWLFWPFVPATGSTGTTRTGITSVWARVAATVGRRPRRIWVSTALLLAALAFGMLDLGSAPTAQQGFTGHPESVTGQELVARHFPAGSASPITIITNTATSGAVTAAALATPGVLRVVPEASHPGRIQLAATLSEPDGPAAYANVDALRARVHAIAGADTLVGGQAATSLDTNRATTHDRQVLIPLVLLVVLVILGLLLRAVIAPLLLMASVVLSYLGALGASALIFDRLLGLPGTDPSVPLFGFIFLVALGVDYNIFLMTRVREEAAQHGTRTGILAGLTTTGGVITSAGLVLAAVFTVLTVLPMVQFIEIGVLVALGVLIDTLLVRSLLVPALALELDHRIWWPCRLQRPYHPDTDATPLPGTPVGLPGR